MMFLYLIAILPPPDINEQVLTWKEYMRVNFKCKVALKSPAHITLAPPFSMNVQQQASLQHALEQLASGFTGFPVALENFGAFKPRVIYLQVKPTPYLQAVKSAIEQQFVPAYPLKLESRPFHPHITIANRDLEKADFPLAWQKFSALLYSNRFMADGITLLRHNGQKWEITFKAPFAPAAD